MRLMHRLPALAACVLLSAPWRVLAQQAGETPPGFAKTEVEIPMRDGVHLHTAIYVPTAPHGVLPILFIRTPYGIVGAAGALRSSYLELEADGYIFVVSGHPRAVQVRGSVRDACGAPRDRKDPNAIDESTDAYDTIDWLVKHVPNNNGRVGMLGISYPGWLTVMAMLDPHPALKAVSPQASPADMFLGDDFHHNGAFRLSYGFEYAARMETDKEQAAFSFDEYDTYDWYLKLGALSNVNARYLHGKIPTWNDFVAHPNYDEFWQRQAATPYLDRVTVPTLNVAGWWDQEDFYGPVTIYEALEKSRHQSPELPRRRSLEPRRVVGAGRTEARRDRFRQPDIAVFPPARARTVVRLLAEGQGNAGSGRGADVRGRVEQVASVGQLAAAFERHRRTLYLRARRRIVVRRAGRGARRQWVRCLRVRPGEPGPVPPPADSADVPARRLGVADVAGRRPAFRRRPTRRTDVRDRAAHARCRVAGDIVAHLFAATSGTDGDWIVKLIDVYPDHYDADPSMGGYRADGGERRLSRAVSRRIRRAGADHAEPRRRVHDRSAHAGLPFPQGHRIMVQVQSTWFPIIDRNPQKFVPNIFEATDADFQSARQRIFRSPGQASYLQMPIDMNPPAEAAK